MNATRAILDSGFHFSLWIICDVVFEAGEYNVTADDDKERFILDCAQQIEAFFHDEACGIEEGDELYDIIRSDEVDWQAIAEIHSIPTWETAQETLQSQGAES